MVIDGSRLGVGRDARQFVLMTTTGGVDGTENLRKWKVRGAALNGRGGRLAVDGNSVIVNLSDAGLVFIVR